MARRLTGVAACGLTLALLVLVAGCADASSEENPRIGPRSDGWAGASVGDRRAEEPYSFFGAANLCIDRPGSVIVTEVTMEHTEGGLTIDAFASRPIIPGMEFPQPETFTETLWELGFQPGSTRIETVCPHDSGGPSDDELARLTTEPVFRGFTHLGIQFSKPTDETARGAIIRITYQSGDATYVHRIGFELVLCKGESDSAECDFHDYPWP